MTKGIDTRTIPAILTYNINQLPIIKKNKTSRY